MTERITIPVEIDDQYGANVFYGDTILVTIDGVEKQMECAGWNRSNSDELIVKCCRKGALGLGIHEYYPASQVRIELPPREARLWRELQALKAV